MRHPIVCLLAVCLLASSLQAQDSGEPVDSGVQEQVNVSLLQVDALVMDKKGNTVPDLNKEDFELRIGDQQLDVDTFDVNCPIGAVPDPVKNLDSEARKARKDPEVTIEAIGPGIKRKIVFVFDYYFIAIPDRKWVLDAAQAMLNAVGTDEEEVMIVALAFGVRVEQKFTSDRRQLLNSLRRMEHDKSLWGREFFIGSSGKEYFDDLTVLMDVLEGYPGPKGVVYFSAVRTLSAGRSNDNWFNDVTMHAAAARAAVYPSYTAGLQAGSGSRTSDTLARLANQTGGRMSIIGGGLEQAYRRAQRDLSCRYTLGAYIDPEQGKQRKAVRVHLKEDGYEVRYPEMIKIFSDAEKKKSRSQAAFVDPGPYENPLVRAFAFPSYPNGTNAWETMFMVHFPMPHHDEGGVFDIQAKLFRGSTRVGKYKAEFDVEPAATGDDRPVTLLGDAKLKAGQYDFTVVLSEPDGDEVVSATTDVMVPETPEGLLIMRGPLLGRVVPGGKLIYAADKKKKKKDEGPTRLQQIIGEGNSFQPLIVHQVETSDEMLTYWNACVYGKSEIGSDAVVNRQFTDGDGNTVHELEPIPLKLESAGKNLVCHQNLERYKPDTLPSGEYKFEVIITYANSGDLLAHNVAPLMVN